MFFPPVTQTVSNVRDSLKEFGEARTRGRNISGLRQLAVLERKALERRGSQMAARLSEHARLPRCAAERLADNGSAFW
jgi:hypothetical protein